MLFAESMESMTCTGSAEKLDTLTRKLRSEPVSELSAVLKSSTRGEARTCGIPVWVVFRQEQTYRYLMLEVAPIG